MSHFDQDPPIVTAEARAYDVPTDAPEGDGTLTWESTTLVLVQVTGADMVGTGWTYGPAACVDVVNDQLAGVVAGRSALDVPAAWGAMVAAIRNAGRPGVVGCALSAVDSALWDLKARVLGLPLYRLLGAARDTVPVYGSGGFTTYDDQQLRAQLDHWVGEQAMPRVKIKVAESWGTEPERDLARMRQTRDAIGSDVELFVDANGGYTRKQAVRIMRHAADLDIRWFEEPVSSDDLEGLRLVRDSVTADVTAGEYGYDLAYFHHLLQAEAVDCVQIDVSRCGGITEWMRISSLAAAQGLQVSGHCAPHLHLAVAMATPNLRHLEWFHDHVRVESLLFDGTIDPCGGDLTPDQFAPGNGVQVRWPDAARYRMR